jgi:hypothetical protein
MSLLNIYYDIGFRLDAVISGCVPLSYHNNWNLLDTADLFMCYAREHYSPGTIPKDVMAVFYRFYELWDVIESFATVTLTMPLFITARNCLTHIHVRYV